VSAVQSFCVLLGATWLAVALGEDHFAEMMLLAAILVGCAEGLHSVWVRRIV
jgi:uncharacterized membrane protein YccC